MTIGQYLNDLEKLPAYRSKNGATLKDSLINSTSIWSNDAAKGYALHAMTEAGLELEQISEVLRQMSQAFNDMPVDGAEQFYNEH